MKVRTAILMSVFLLVQIASNSLNQTVYEQDESTFDFYEEFSFMSSNNSSGNSTGGNNSGGNNTGGNNSGGDNTGSNNTGSNNTGGNNTGGNNTGGNNSGGNNTGGNSTTSDAHCLELSNLSISPTYNVTLNLVNTCNFSINYPGINASADNSNVQGLYHAWWYMIGWSNSSYAIQTYYVQLSFNQSIQNGTMITLNFEATVLNCGQNNSWSHQCPNSNNSSLSIQFQYIEPPKKLVISSASISSYYSYNDRINIGYYSQNYSGYVYWEYTSANGTSTHSSYTSSSYRTTYFYPDTFGTIQICGSIPGDTTCVNVTRDMPILTGSIYSPSNNFITSSSSIYLQYFASNYTNGSIEVNGNNTYTIPTYSYVNNSSLRYQYVYLPMGNSTICLNLHGYNNSSITDCIQVYREPPVVRLTIESAVLSSNSSYIVLRYSSENYSGTVYWTYNSTDGTSSTYSYTTSYTRNAYIYPNTFGIIEICGTINNSVTECVSVNRIARIVEGGIVSPSTNSQYNSGLVSISFSANNYTSGSINLNGVEYHSLGYSFGINSSSSHNGSQSDYLYIPYGLSTICLELVGEDGTQLSDCITIERIVPPHSVSITYPTTGANIIGQALDLSYTLENSSNHYFTVDGTQTNPITNTSSPARLNLGFGTKIVCVVSSDYAGTEFSSCVTVDMIDPNADSDSDSVPDHSDNCPNTLAGWSVGSDGCAAYQLDSDSDGVTDDLDICSNTQRFSNVDANGCAAYQRDSDGDGVMDNLDACPATPVNSVVDAYGCAISQIDSDNDGVMDDVDLCPGTFVGSQVNADGCAPSQLDSDSDGIVDSFDQCPNTPVGTVVDQTGCSYTNSGNNSGNGSGSESDSGSIPGFEATYLLMSVTIALFVIARKKTY